MSASSSCSLGVAGFARVCLVRSSAPCWSLVFFSDSSGSSGCALGVAWFGRVRVLSPAAPIGSLVLFGSSASFRCTAGVAAFLLCVWMPHKCRSVHSGGSALSDCALRIAGFVRVRLVGSAEPCGLLDSSGFV